MAIRLDVLDSADGTYRITIQGNLYTIKTRWNTRTKNWYMAVLDNEETVIIDFEKILPRQPLVFFNKTLFASGNLYVVNTKKDNTLKMTRDNFGNGKTFQLVYK